MSTNVYEHPTVSWDKAKSAFERIERKEGELIAAWIELGTQLNLLRAKFPVNQDFGAACQSHGIDLTHQHRKAAMWLASLDADQLDSLRQYNPTAIHPATLENRCREQFPEWLTSTRVVVHSVDTADRQSDESEKPEIPASELEKTADEPVTKNAEKVTTVNLPRLDGRVPMVRIMGEDITRELYSQWTNKQTRVAFGRLVQAKGGKAVISRIVEMIDTHCLERNDRDYQHKFSHRVFVPDIHIGLVTQSWL